MKEKEMKKNMFSPGREDELGSYVYCLVDPRDSQIFYVGKGRNSRVFDHLNGTLKADSNEKLSLKVETIKEILAEGLEIKHYILRHGLSNDQAILLESLLINLFNYTELGLNKVTKLTNIMSGFEKREYGIKTVEEIDEYYNVEDLDKIGNLQHKLLFINVNKRYERENMYDVTRKFWKLSPTRANKADYVVSESRGVIKAIFKVNEKGWQKSEDYKDPYAFQSKDKTETIEELKGVEGRYFFEGEEVKDENILNLYINKKISKNLGASNPIRYNYQ